MNVLPIASIQIPQPPVLVVQAVGFLLVLLILKLFLFKPIGDMLQARSNEIEGRFENADTQQQIAEELRASYEQRLAGIEEEMRAKITASIKEGQAIREEIITDSRTKADQILTKAQEEIAREKEIALAEIKGKVADLTVAAASRIIEEELDDQKHRKLVDKFISGMDEVVR